MSTEVNLSCQCARVLYTVHIYILSSRSHLFAGALGFREHAAPFACSQVAVAGWRHSLAACFLDPAVCWQGSLVSCVRPFATTGSIHQFARSACGLPSTSASAWSMALFARSPRFQGKVRVRRSLQQGCRTCCLISPNDIAAGCLLRLALCSACQT